MALFFMATNADCSKGRKTEKNTINRSIHCLPRQLNMSEESPVVKTFGQSVESFNVFYTSIIVMKDSVLKMTMGYRIKCLCLKRLRVRRRFSCSGCFVYYCSGRNPHEVVADSIIYFLIGPISEFLLCVLRQSVNIFILQNWLLIK